MKQRFLKVLGVACLFFSGCVSTTVPPADSSPPRLMVVRGGQEVQLTWQSRRGQVYNVLFTDSVGNNARWEILPGYVNMTGTGEDFRAVDYVPTHIKRRYKLDTISK